MSKATSRSLNRSAISTATAVILTAIIAGSLVFVGTFAYFALQSAPAQQLGTQPKPPLEKIRVSSVLVASTSEYFFLPIDTANERGVWAKYGLDPEFAVPDPAVGVGSIKAHVASGIKIGVNIPAEVLIARSQDVPVKIVSGYIGNATAVRLYVKGDGPIKTLKDLDGRKFGVVSTAHWTYRHASLLSAKHGIKPEFTNMEISDLATNVAALKVGRIDAFITAAGAALRLEGTGELRALLTGSDIYPKPWVGNVIWATDDLIEQNPELVRRFVKAWLEAIKHVKENPSYATDLYMKKSNALKDLAEKVTAQLDWRPDGMKQDLLAAAKVNWQFNKEAGTIPADANLKIEDAVDIRFLP